MSLPTTIGLPRMHKESGEKRVFLPDFVKQLAHWGMSLFLEEGYGARSGRSWSDYQQGLSQVQSCSRADAFRQDVVLLLRAPERQELDLLRPGSCLVSMMHYQTRPWRVARLQELGIQAISLDAITDDEGGRLVENMQAVAWNGLEAAFNLLELRLPNLERPDHLPVHVLILGAGLVGKHAVEAATKLGKLERYHRYLREERAAAIVQVVGRTITKNPALMQRLLAQSDILVDASARSDTSRPVTPNGWLQWLPDHAVIADLAVDPYLLSDNPPVVRGIEGIPQGSLNQYTFLPTDPHWTDSIPDGIPSHHRRAVVSCYSWPGIYPDACMAHYGRQLLPLLEVLLEKGYDALSLSGGYFERALARAKLPASPSLYP